MSKFDLRKYLPLLGVMGYLDDTSEKQAELNNEILKLSEAIDNLKFEVSIECKNEEKHNAILNELVEKYGAENKNNLGIIEDEFEKIFQKDIEKFLQAWNYLLIKYKQYINEYEYIELSLVDSILRYISRYDEDRVYLDFFIFHNYFCNIEYLFFISRFFHHIFVCIYYIHFFFLSCAFLSIFKKVNSSSANLLQ